MDILKHDDGGVQVSDIQGDMGEPTRLQLIVQGDGDVVVSIQEKGGSSLGIEFCSLGGGGRDPEVTLRLRQLAWYLAGIPY